MKGTQRLYDAGQSIWLDNITRALLRSGGLERYIREFSVTGLTSNPTILDHATKQSSDYDAAIRAKTAAGKSAPTRPTAIFSRRIAGSGSLTAVRGRSVFSGRALEPRTRRPRTFSTSSRSPRPTR
jgi:hypothetical protein